MLRLSDGDITEDEIVRESDDIFLFGNIINVFIFILFIEFIFSSSVFYWCVSYFKFMYMYFSCRIIEKELYFVFKYVINVL